MTDGLENIQALQWDHITHCLSLWKVFRIGSVRAEIQIVFSEAWFVVL